VRSYKLVYEFISETSAQGKRALEVIEGGGGHD